METVVFAARIPQTDDFGKVYPPERQAEIDRITNPDVKREKYFVWKLLEYAIEKTAGEPIENYAFEKKPNRKWVSDRLCFSLSHSDGAVAVALSDSAVGVDIEVIRPRRAGLEKSILTQRELTELPLLDAKDSWEYIIMRWTQKESIFKAGDRNAFEPVKIETSEYSVRSEKLEFDGESFMLSVSAPDAHKVKFEIYNF